MNKLYKIINSDGRYSIGGMPGSYRNWGNHWRRFGKLWVSGSAIKKHLAQFKTKKYDTWENPYSSDCEVIEYELTEKRRIPIKEFYNEIAYRDNNGL